MRQCMDADNLHRRLRKIIGQVQAIDRMVDEDVPCEDILAQINAAKSALHRAGQVVLEGHIRHCVRDGIEHGDADQTIESFTKALRARTASGGICAARLIDGNVPIDRAAGRCHQAQPGFAYARAADLQELKPPLPCRGGFYVV